MNKLDLSVYADKVWELKMVDGTDLHIKKPSQKQLIVLNSYDEKLQAVEEFEAKLKMLNEVAVFILNNNKEDKKYKVKDTEEFPIDILYAIFYGYMGFITEVTSNPN